MFGNDDEKPQVKCDVENCAYNHSNSCSAGSIEVDCSGSDKAQSCDSTKCSTFKKDSSYSM